MGVLRLEGWRGRTTTRIKHVAVRAPDLERTAALTGRCSTRGGGQGRVGRDGLPAPVYRRPGRQVDEPERGRVAAGALDELPERLAGQGPEQLGRELPE